MPMREHPPTPDSASSDTYERRDIAPQPIVAAVLAAVGVIAVIFVAMALLTGWYSRHIASESPPANPLAAQFDPKQPPLPRLQTEPVKDLRTLRASEDKILHSYAWLDRAAGTVRIPIERAIDAVAQRGLPARQAPPAGGKE